MGFLDRFFGPPTEDQFAKVVIDTLRRVGDVRTPTYDKSEFRLTFISDGKPDGIINLRNLYKEYCNAPRKDRKALLVRSCQGFAFPMEIPTDFEDARPDLLPTLRTRSLLDVMRLDAELEGNKPIELAWVPLCDDLIICLVYDLPHSMQFVTQETLTNWGISLYEAIECARHNLEERQQVMMMSIGDKLFIIETGDAYDAARLLHTEKVLKLPLAGQPVAMAVTRDCLMLTGSEDEEGLGMMALLVEKKRDEARPLYPVPLRLVADEWETWLPAADHPHFDKFKLFELQYRVDEYGTQKTQLEQRNEQLGHDIFIATFSALERNGKLLSYAVWAKEVPTWLPKTEYVTLYDPDRKFTGAVPWERLEQVVGHLMEPVDCHPPRWSVSEFPSLEQLERLRPEDWSK